MNEAKHTPTPWRMRLVGDEECGYWVIEDESGHCLALEGTRTGSPRPHMGNAALFLAAPDLLAALEGVVRVADRKTAEFDAARAALTSATGEDRR